MRPLIIGARGSSLSLCQTRLVQATLEARVPARRFELKTIKAKADEHPEASLAAIAGEGVFVKELEAALMRGEVDLAVHSMKDLPLQIPEQLVVAAITERDDPRDALISQRGTLFRDLPAGSRIGTSSLRRRSQVLCLRSDLQMVDIRGNVDTRLRKLDEGRYDAIVVAACGVIRLGLEARIADYFRLEELLPEPGQGALAIETRADDADVRTLVATVEDETARTCVMAERAMLGVLGGGCRVPIAAFAQVEGDEVVVQGAVVAPDGSRMIRDSLRGPAISASIVGETLGRTLLARGAGELLDQVSR